MATPHDLSRAQWRKSARSSANGQCVEVATIAHMVAVRDSTDPGGPILMFGAEAWTRFSAAAKSGTLEI